mgnify:CR=1 FL=1
MYIKRKTLLIGKSLIIKKAIFYFFKNKKIKNLSFRKSWNNLNSIGNFEYIIVSGFHFEICKIKKYELDKYILKYSNYIHRISGKCKKVYLICTDLNLSHSFSRVVYFYYNLLKKLKKNKYVEILSFKTLYGIEKKSHQKLKILILKFIGVKIVHYKNLTKILNKYKLSKKKIIKFYLIKVPRSRNFDRLIRLFIDLILIKFIKKFSPTLR